MIPTVSVSNIRFSSFFECSKYFSVNFYKSPAVSILANSTFYQLDILLFWFKVMVLNKMTKSSTAHYRSVGPWMINPPSHLSLTQFTATFVPTSKCFVIGPHFVCSFDGAHDTCPYFFGVGTQRFFRGFLHLIFGMVGM